MNIAGVGAIAELSVVLFFFLQGATLRISINGLMR